MRFVCCALLRGRGQWRLSDRSCGRLVAFLLRGAYNGAIDAKLTREVVHAVHSGYPPE